MSTWTATIEAWPYSTGIGRDEDQKAAGERSQEFTFHADDIGDAVEIAKLIAAGIKVNPRVWQAPDRKACEETRLSQEKRSITGDIRNAHQD